MISDKDLARAYRALNPRSRAASVIKYTHNGGTARERGCVLCGARGPGWCGRWPRTQQSLEWERVHIAHHEAGNDIPDEIASVLGLEPRP